MTPDLAPRRVPQPPPKGLRGVLSEQPAPTTSGAS
jgi:hypothetical protein